MTCFALVFCSLLFIQFFRYQRYQAFIPFQHQAQNRSVSSGRTQQPTNPEFNPSDSHYITSYGRRKACANPIQSTHNQQCVSAPAPQHKTHTRKLHVPAPSKSKAKANLRTVHTTIHGFSVRRTVRIAGQGEVGQLDLHLQLLPEEEGTAVVGLVVVDIMVEDVMMVEVVEEAAAVAVVVVDVRRG